MTVTEFNNRLEAVITASADVKGDRVIVAQAMKYSLMAGGKRLRAMLSLGFCEAVSGDPERALPAAFCVELIHAFSLIHDDLPCMDDDNLRRGKPSCHIAFGEANALLAGDAMSLLSTEVITDDEQLSDNEKLRLIRLFSKASGIDGMIGGQTLDLLYETKTPTLTEIELMYELKTAALISAAAQSGIISGGGTPEQESLAEAFGKKIGLAFQIEDDILDITADPELLGKPIGSDEKSGKTTYVTLSGMEASKVRVKGLYDEAFDILKKFDNNKKLIALTEELSKRKY
ncbi:MAG: polyprenyl synthetase family protein [Ruminococcus sp.]|jgi:geranylgeranyl diphosphate synthase type II|nr:polyprenyl synthetase family protein [Ruminococcus sp.]